MATCWKNVHQNCKIQRYPIPVRRTGAGSLRLVICVVLILATVVGWWLFINRPGLPLPKPPVPPSLSNEQLNEQLKERERFFAFKVRPQLEAYHQQNLHAAQRCIEQIRSDYQRYRKKVPEFCAEITRFGSQLSLARKMIGDWWNNTSGAGQYIQGAFEQMVVSQEQLTSDITNALKGFKKDVEANRQAMLASIKAAVSQSNLPEIVLPNYDDFYREAIARLAEHLRQLERRIIVNTVATFVASEIAATLATQIVGRTAALAGGAAAGTATGTAGGPLGVAVGFGAGLIVGALVDWWMSEQFQAKLVGELNTYLGDLERAVVNGSKNAKGLEHELKEICDKDLRAVEEIFRRSLLEGAQ